MSLSTTSLFVASRGFDFVSYPGGGVGAEPYCNDKESVVFFTYSYSMGRLIVCLFSVKSVLNIMYITIQNRSSRTPLYSINNSVLYARIYKKLQMLH